MKQLLLAQHGGWKGGLQVPAGIEGGSVPVEHVQCGRSCPLVSKTFFREPVKCITSTLNQHQHVIVTVRAYLAAGSRGEQINAPRIQYGREPFNDLPKQRIAFGHVRTAKARAPVRRRFSPLPSFSPGMTRGKHGTVVHPPALLLLSRSILRATPRALAGIGATCWPDPLF